MEEEYENINEFKEKYQNINEVPIETTKNPYNEPIWECLIDNAWVEYNTDDNKLINSHFEKSPTNKLKIVTSFSNHNNYFYEFNFSTMLQTNCQTRLERPIRCIQLISPASINFKLIPYQWECLIDGEWTKYAKWDNKIIDKNFKSDPMKVFVTKTSFSKNQSIYQYDFINMVQINIITGFRRQIRYKDLTKTIINKDTSNPIFRCFIGKSYVNYTKEENKMLYEHYINNPNGIYFYKYKIIKISHYMYIT